MRPGQQRELAAISWKSINGASNSAVTSGPGWRTTSSSTRTGSPAATPSWCLAWLRCAGNMDGMPQALRKPDKFCNYRQDKSKNGKNRGGSYAGKNSGFGTSIGTIALASAIGTTIEWYDFFLFGVVTPLVLNKLFFPELRSSGRHVAGVHDFLRRVHIASDRRHHFRPLWRPYRPQDRARSHHPHHGHCDIPDRVAADLCHRRHLGPDHVALPSHLPRHWHWRRMGRRGVDGGRTFSEPAGAASMEAGRRSACRPACC